MTETIKGRAVVTVRSRAALRDWLRENHRQADAVWLATFKKHHRDYLEWGQAVAELICWGWIDAVSQGVDRDRSAHMIAPRRPSSGWSAVNKRIVAAARADGAMTQAGEAAITVAQANGMWSFLDDVDACIVPADLDASLGGLRAVWDAWPRSVRRGSLEWIKTARTDPTRGRRIADVVDSAAAGLRPSPFRR